MRENTVALILEESPSYLRLVGNSPMAKNNDRLTLKVRNTIPWSLECELERDEDR